MNRKIRILFEKFSENKRKEWDRISQLTWKKRLRYLWDYYRVWILGTIFILFSIAVMMPEKDTRILLGKCMIETQLYEAGDAYLRKALEAEGYDSEQYGIKCISLAALDPDEILNVRNQVALNVHYNEVDMIMCTEATLPEIKEMDIFPIIRNITNMFDVLPETASEIYLCMPAEQNSEAVRILDSYTEDY